MTKNKKEWERTSGKCRSSVWKTEVLPLHNARVRFFYMAMEAGHATPFSAFTHQKAAQLAIF
ncbi:MAG: hypothetical protein ACI9HB_000682 [Gammaproteobacteria bacterium]|jgi:hypothetical protein